MENTEVSSKNDDSTLSQHVKVEIEYNTNFQNEIFETYEDEEIKIEESQMSKHECNFCNRIFSDDFNLTEHIKKNHNDVSIDSISDDTVKLYKCGYPNCGKSFGDSYALIMHVTVHNNNKLFQCKHAGCTKTFKRKNDLKEHKKVHVDEKEYKCSFDGCGKSFRYNSILRSHLRLHSDSTPFKCLLAGCDKAFKTKAYLNYHEKSHNPLLIECSFPGCSSTFKAKNVTYYKHMQYHRVGKRFRCSFDRCHAAFYEKTHLKRHLKVHTGDNDQFLKSKRNNETFDDVGSNTIKKETLRDDDLEIMIETNQRNNEDLVKTVEQRYDVDLYTCGYPDCGEIFKSCNELNSHARVHTIDMAVECKHAGCSKTFRSKKDLNIHMKLHSESKPFKCSQNDCEKAFNRKDYLDNHLRTHSRKPISKNLKKTLEINNPSRSNNSRSHQKDDENHKREDEDN